MSVLRFITIQAQVATYPLPSCFTESENHTVTIIQNNKEYKVPVRKFMAHDSVFYDYAQFSFSGDITVAIKDKNENVNSYEIAPLSYQTKAIVANHQLSFKLSNPRYLQVDINNNRPLYILADSLEKDVPHTSGKNIYNITSSKYNADNTGENDVTHVFQKAIDDAAKAGGGTVFVPNGIFKLSKIQAKSNVNIYLQGGSVLKSWIASEGAKSTRMIEGDNVSNVRIYGRGTIWCNGTSANNNKKTDMQGSTRIGGIKIANHSSGIEIDGITINESTIWTIGFHDETNNVSVKNTKILNATDWNWNDGFDVCGGYNTELNHCFYVGADDAACCKVYKNDPIHDVYFHDFVVYSEHSSGFKAGMQAYDNLYNIKVEDFRIINCKRGFNFDHWYGTGKWGGNIVVKNFWIDAVTGVSKKSLSACGYIDAPFRFVICDKDNTGVGSIDGVSVENIFYPKGPNPAYLKGYDENTTISNILFKNIRYNNEPVKNGVGGNIKELEFVNNIEYINSDNVNTE